SLRRSSRAVRAQHGAGADAGTFARGRSRPSSRRRCRREGRARVTHGEGVDPSASPDSHRPRFESNRASDSTPRRSLMHTAIPAIAGVPIEFILFAAVLAGVALFHHHSLRVALIGVAVITLYKIAFSSFHGETGVGGLTVHLAKEWVLIVNLLLLIVGFA